MNRYLKLCKNRNFFLLTFADAISILGDQVGWVSLLWFATTTTKDPSRVGLIGFVFGLPAVLMAPIAGNILDRISHKAVLFVANLLLGFIFMMLPVLYLLHVFSLAGLLGLVFVAGCFVPFTSVGWMVIVPNLVDENELTIANSIVETIMNSSMLAGPIIGGLIIAKWGSTTSIFLDGISFWIAALCIQFLNMKSQKHQKHAKEIPIESIEKRSFLWDVWIGLKRLYHEKIVWWVTVAAFLLTLSYGQLEVSLPLFTHQELSMSAIVLGGFWGTYFLSSIIGSTLCWLIPLNNHSGIFMAIMVIGWGISFAPMIWIHSALGTYLCMAMAGLLFSGYPPLARSTAQQLIPIEFQGRMMGVRGSLIAIGPPIGAYLGGALGSWFPSSTIIGFTGILVLLFGTYLLLRRDFRTLGTTCKNTNHSE